MNTKISILVAGKKRSGKDTYSKILMNSILKNDDLNHKTCGVMSFADELRSYLSLLDPVVYSPDIDSSSISSIDPPNMTITWNLACDIYGYESAKDIFPRFRRWMQLLGTEIMRDRVDQNFWAKKACQRAMSMDIAILSDCRFQSEYKHFMGEYASIGGIVLPVCIEMINPTLDNVPGPDPSSSGKIHISEDLQWILGESFTHVANYRGDNFKNITKHAEFMVNSIKNMIYQ